jgi:hypothetical protein
MRELFWIATIMTVGVSLGYVASVESAWTEDAERQAISTDHILSAKMDEAFFRLQSLKATE